MRTSGINEQLRKRLHVAAHEEVRAVVTALPSPLRVHARSLPVIFEMKPNASEIKQGIEPDTLGLFSGDALADRDSGTNAGPTEIILFMENIWDYAHHEAATFRREVRRTYLHELGHYLGLDEDALAERDLD